MYHRYKELNRRSSEMYRKYDDKVPKFLHNRPKGIVQHIMKRSYLEYPKNLVRSCSKNLFMVKSSSTNEEYQVWFGSENQLASCQCVDYKINKLPCKHICAVVNLPGIGRESLGASFQNHPLFRLDPTVVSTTSCEGQQTAVISCIESNNNNPQLGSSGSESLDKTVENDNSHASTVDYSQLKHRKQHMKPSGRNRCVSTLKALHDELYMIKDRAVLATLETMITNALTYARQN